MSCEFEHEIYLRYRLDCDDAYVGRSKRNKARQAEHWRLDGLLPHMLILERVRTLTDAGALRLAHATETSWRRDFHAAGIRLLNVAGRPKSAPRPEEPISGELMPMRGVYKTHYPRTLPDAVRDALARRGLWIHGFGAPPARTPRRAKPWPLREALPPGVTECRTRAELCDFRAANPEGWALGFRDSWRMQRVGKFKQNPSTGSHVFCVPNSSRRSLDALVRVLLTHERGRKVRARVTMMGMP
jgi:hypothetical protein